MMSNKIIGHPCPKCFKRMENLGNVDNFIMTSNPPQWHDTWVCHNCKVKKKFLVVGEKHLPSAEEISSYEELP